MLRGFGEERLRLRGDAARRVGTPTPVQPARLRAGRRGGARITLEHRGGVAGAVETDERIVPAQPDEAGIWIALGERARADIGTGRVGEIRLLRDAIGVARLVVRIGAAREDEQRREPTRGGEGRRVHRDRPGQIGARGGALPRIAQPVGAIDHEARVAIIALPQRARARLMQQHRQSRGIDAVPFGRDERDLPPRRPRGSGGEQHLHPRVLILRSEAGTEQSEQPRLVIGRGRAARPSEARGGLSIRGAAQRAQRLGIARLGLRR